MRVFEFRSVLAMGLVATAVACGDGPTAPGDPLSPPPPVSGLTFALTADSVLPRGALLSEVLIEVPDSATADSAVVLWTAGQLSGPGLVEVISEVLLDNRAVPAAEILSQGGVTYYRSDGELVFRFVFVNFFAPQFQSLLRLDAPDPVELLDPTAPEHALRLTWSISEEMSSGFNIHSGEPPPDYLYMDSFVAVLPPLFSPENISDSPPRGTIRVRAFATSSGEEVRIARVGGGALTVRPERTGTNGLDLEVGVFDAAGQPIPNRMVGVDLSVVEGSGGHANVPGPGDMTHASGRPLGTLSPAPPYDTGPSGLVTVTYTAPAPSGQIVLKGTSSGATEANDTIAVQVEGLVQIPLSGPNYTFQPTTRHQSADFYMAPGAIEVLNAIWKEYVDRGYPVKPAKTFTITAAGLEEGGLFDIFGDWKTPHRYHRQGGDLDFDDASAEADLRFMKRVCSEFTYGGREVDCQFHNGNHFHAVLGPNR